MFKRTCTRAIIPVALTMTGFVAVCCFLLYSVIKADITESTIRYSVDLADTIIKSARYTMLKDDRETLQRIIDNIGEQQNIRHVRIFNKKGLIMFSADPAENNRLVDKSAAGCLGCHEGPEPLSLSRDAMEKARQFQNADGEGVLAITAPIYNEPSCISSACHFHGEDQQMLGILDIGLSRSPLDRTLSLLGWRMLGFSFMILILSVGGVAALLTKSVFEPIRILDDHAQRAADGQLERDLPELEGDLGRIAKNHRRMAEQLRQARSESANPDQKIQP